MDKKVKANKNKVDESFKSTAQTCHEKFDTDRNEDEYPNAIRTLRRHLEEMFTTIDCNKNHEQYAYLKGIEYNLFYVSQYFERYNNTINCKYMNFRKNNSK